MKKNKLFVIAFVVAILVVVQFFFIVLRENYKLQMAVRNWNPETITLQSLGFISDRFIEDYNIKKVSVDLGGKKALIVFIGNDQSYFDRKIISNMFIYGPNLRGETVLKDFQSITLNPKDEQYFNEVLPALPMVDKTVDINNDGNYEIVLNLGKYPGYGNRYTVLSYNVLKEDLKWLTLKDRNGNEDQAWFFEGSFDKSLLHFEIDEKNNSVYQFVGVMPDNVEDELDLDKWQWKADVFMLGKDSLEFIQQ